ncbi:MAG: hypothetical protein OEM29_04145 [Thermoplasmata archaeon]|nr:hypothetical protein [Thermoplasmata archaeon]
MIAIVDIMLGALMGASLFLLILSVVSYRRSGVFSVLLVAIGLTIHSALTMSIIIVGHTTDILANVDGIQLVGLDILALVAALLLGVLGGKAFARSS